MIDVYDSSEPLRLGWYIKVQISKRKTNKRLLIPYDMRKANGPILDACEKIDDATLFLWEPMKQDNQVCYTTMI